jgi:hypothetical protein
MKNRNDYYMCINPERKTKDEYEMAKSSQDGFEKVMKPINTKSTVPRRVIIKEVNISLVISLKRHGFFHTSCGLT